MNSLGDKVEVGFLVETMLKDSNSKSPYIESFTNENGGIYYKWGSLFFSQGLKDMIDEEFRKHISG